MPKPTVAIIAAGNMGAAVAARLTRHGLTVLTSLAGRSSASEARARAAGMRPLAERLAPSFKSSGASRLYVDCNALSPATKARVGTIATAAGLRFVDGAIIGPPPKPDGTSRTILYVSGEHADAVMPLGGYGIEVRRVKGGIGAAAALKMSYAAVTKGLTALGTASLLAATKAGITEELRRELEESQPGVLAFLARGVPDMCPKAYRWVAEMEEIGKYTCRPDGEQIYNGIARLYEAIALDLDGDRRDVDRLEAFFNAARRG